MVEYNKYLDCYFAMHEGMAAVHCRDILDSASRSGVILNSAKWFSKN